MSTSGNIARRASARVSVGPVRVGGGAPIVVQSMTNTDTADIEGTVRQVQALARAGSELVRLTVNTSEAAAAVAPIRERLDRAGVGVPLIGDFHFNGHKLLREHPDCAAALAKYRINPGNVGCGSKRDPQFAEMIEVACRHDKPVRIGVNWGSLDTDLLTRLMDENSTSATPLTAQEVTRSAVVLQEGIGDTIRVSLTPEPGGDRTQEVIVAQEILQTIGLRAFTPLVVVCPGCGRTTSSYFQELAQSIQSHIRTRMPQWRREYAGVEDMTVAVMGCVVNGPGESRLANIGISLPGTGERAVAPVYEDGEKTVTLKGERIAEEFQEIVERYVARRYARSGDA